jgi:hypothetical protein
VGFAQSNVADQDDVGAGCDEVETKQVLDLRPIDLFRPAPLEVIEGFADGKASVFDSPLDAARLACGELTLNELGEIVDV